MNKKKVVISFKKVTKKFPMQTDKTAKEMIPNLLRGKSWAKTQTVFSDLSLSINQGETIGVVGQNGAGKSTLLKLIAGVTYPTQGEVMVSGRVAPLIELGAGFHHELTGYENIFLNAAILGLKKEDIEKRVNKIVDFSGLKDYMQMPIKRYSTGMSMRLAFSIAIQAQADILLIDEVLAVGDAAFQKKCWTKLKEIKQQKNKTIVFVSHDEKQVKRFCERAIWLEDGQIKLDAKPKEIFAKYNA